MGPELRLDIASCHYLGVAPPPGVCWLLFHLTAIFTFEFRYFLEPSAITTDSETLEQRIATTFPARTSATAPAVKALPLLIGPGVLGGVMTVGGFVANTHNLVRLFFSPAHTRSGPLLSLSDTLSPFLPVCLSLSLSMSTCLSDSLSPCPPRHLCL